MGGTSEERYHVILADPPWQYRVYTGKTGPAKRGRSGMRGVATRHYQTAPLADIAAIPVSTLASDDAALFLWVTMPCLPEGLDVMRAWGFTFKTTAFTWVKQNRSTGKPHLGLGHYTRGNAELCLLGLRGRMERHAKDVSQIILSPRREHSRKPDEQYQRIMRLFDGPYLEMFARQRWPGWDTWGNEVDRFDVQLPLLEASA